MRLKDWFDKISYSQEIHIPDASSNSRHWPNPVQDKLFAELSAVEPGTINYTITNSNGIRMKDDSINMKGGKQVITIPVDFIGKGIYYLGINGTVLTRPVAFTFIK